MMTPAASDFEDFVRSNLDGLVRTAGMIVWDLREAEDLVQDCLFKVARRWGRVGSMEDPLAYTRRVLIHLALRQSGRRGRQRAELELTAAEDAVETAAMAGLETREELLEALAQLPARQRAAIVLRYFLDLTEAETARALGCSTGTVKSNTSKGLTRLRESFSSTQPCAEVYEP
jgi:RNA polymerase sigma-70 factor (sigma-E family)